MILKTRSLTGRPFNVNVFCHEPAQRDADVEAQWLKHLTPLFNEFGVEVPAGADEIYTSFIRDETAFRMLLELRPAVVSFHFGLPEREWINALQSAGIRTLATATNPREAVAIEAAGIDAIVAQGIEAGGHRGMFDPDAIDEGLSTSVLVRMLVTTTTLPIFAAGGIMDGFAIRAALDLGAMGAQLSTAFILCPESAANASYRDNIKSARSSATRLTSVFSGRPARGILNRFMEYAQGVGTPAPAAYPVAYDLAKQIHAGASKRGSSEFAAHWAGQGAPLAREMAAGELIRILAEEMQAGT